MMLRWNSLEPATSSVFLSPDVSSFNPKFAFPPPPVPLDIFLLWLFQNSFFASSLKQQTNLHHRNG